MNSRILVYCIGAFICAIIGKDLVIYWSIGYAIGLLSDIASKK